MKILNLNQFNEKMKIIPLSDDEFDKIPDYLYKYNPETKDELKSIISKRMDEDGCDCNLNDIDVSKIKDMSFLFAKYEKGGGFIEDNISAFSGDISQWDVSNVENMEGMFLGAGYFNGDISQWDVSNVTNMGGMFNMTDLFNCDISEWNVSKVTDMNGMFNYAESFNRDISKWDVSNVTKMDFMFNFAYSFNCDLSGWDVRKVKTNYGIFFRCPMDKQPEKQPIFNK